MKKGREVCVVRGLSAPVWYLASLFLLVELPCYSGVGGRNGRAKCLWYLVKACISRLSFNSEWTWLQSRPVRWKWWALCLSRSPSDAWPPDCWPLSPR